MILMVEQISSGSADLHQPPPAAAVNLQHTLTPPYFLS